MPRPRRAGRVEGPSSKGCRPLPVALLFNGDESIFFHFEQVEIVAVGPPARSTKSAVPDTLRASASMRTRASAESGIGSEPLPPAGKDQIIHPAFAVIRRPPDRYSTLAFVSSYSLHEPRVRVEKSSASRNFSGRGGTGAGEDGEGDEDLPGTVVVVADGPGWREVSMRKRTAATTNNASAIPATATLLRHLLRRNPTCRHAGLRRFGLGPTGLVPTGLVSTGLGRTGRWRCVLSAGSHLGAAGALDTAGARATTRARTGISCLPP